MNKILKIVLIFISFIFVLYGIPLILIIGAESWINYAFIIGGILLFAFTMLYDWLKRRAKALLYAILIVAAVFVLAAGVFIGNAIHFANQQPDMDADWVIVLGAKVNYDGPSLELIRRLQACTEYVGYNEDAVIITTGGQGPAEPGPEADAAKESLIELGVDEERIICESVSRSTKDNLLFSKDIIESLGGSADDSVVIISSKFHLFRASLLAKDAGYTNASYYGYNGLPLLIPFYYCREFAAFCGGLIGVSAE